jgi:hypothetical protein
MASLAKFVGWRESHQAEPCGDADKPLPRVISFVGLGGQRMRGPARMGPFASLRSRRETFVARLYGLRTVGSQSVLPRGSESILSCGLSYLLALHWVRLLAVLRKGGICHQQNKANYECESRHSCSVLLSPLDALRVNLPRGFWLRS